MTAEERLAAAIEEIRKLAPAQLKVKLRDGEEREVAMPTAGNRWARLAKLLDGLAWEELECLDKGGKLLGIVKGSSEDDEVGDVEAGVEDSEAQHIARIINDTVKTTMHEVRLMFEPVLRGMAMVVDNMAQGQQALVESYSAAMRIQQATAAAAASGAGGEGDGEMAQMLKAAMAMMMMEKKPKEIPGGKP